KEVSRSMTAGTNRVKKIASVEAVTVFMVFDYTDDKPTLNIRIIAEESDQSKVADEVRKIKKRFEEGKGLSLVFLLYLPDHVEGLELRLAFADHFDFHLRVVLLRVIKLHDNHYKRSDTYHVVSIC